MTKFRSLSNYKLFDYNKCTKEEVLVTGRFVGTEKNAQYGNDDYLFSPEEGPTVKLWGSGHLRWQMERVRQGDLVQVKYMGKEKLTEGKFKGKDSHQFDVAVAEPEWEQQELPLNETMTTNTDTGNVDLSSLD